MSSTMLEKDMRPIIVISLITAVCLIGDSMLYIALPTHWKEVGLFSLWEVGILLSVNRLARLPLNPMIGWLYKKISTRNGIIFASILSFFTTVSYGFLSDFWPLFITRCIWGLAWTFLRLGAYFAIIDYSKECNRGYCMGTYNGLYRLGSLVGMLLGGFLADHYGLRITALLFGIMTFLSIPLSFLYIPNSVVNKSNKELQTVPETSIFKNTDVIGVLVTGMLITMIYQGMFTATLSYLVEVHNSALITLFGFTIGAASLAGIIQAIRWSWEPWLAPWFGKKTDGRYGRKPTLAISLLIASVLFALIPLEMPLLYWLALLIGIQITATVLTTVIDAIASDIAVVSSSKIGIMTAYSLAIDLGAALGPVLGYLMNMYLGVYAAYWGAGLILVLIGIKFSSYKIATR